MPTDNLSEQRELSQPKDAHTTAAEQQIQQERLIEGTDYFSHSLKVGLRHCIERLDISNFSPENFNRVHTASAVIEVGSEDPLQENGHLLVSMHAYANEVKGKGKSGLKIEIQVTPIEAGRVAQVQHMIETDPAEAPISQVGVQAELECLIDAGKVVVDASILKKDPRVKRIPTAMALMTQAGLREIAEKFAPAFYQHDGNPKKVELLFHAWSKDQKTQQRSNWTSDKLELLGFKKLDPLRMALHSMKLYGEVPIGEGTSLWQYDLKLPRQAQTTSK